MRNLRLALALALTVSAVLLGTVTLAHAHDATTPGLYSSHCPLNELAGHTLAPPLSPPSAARLDVVASPVPAAPEARAQAGVPGSVAPRAPPLA
jgi:hypothetical protein